MYKKKLKNNKKILFIVMGFVINNILQRIVARHKALRVVPSLCK